eukprot:RCo054101
MLSFLCSMGDPCREGRRGSEGRGGSASAAGRREPRRHRGVQHYRRDHRDVEGVSGQQGAHGPSQDVPQAEPHAGRVQPAVPGAAVMTCNRVVAAGVSEEHPVREVPRQQQPEPPHCVDPCVEHLDVAQPHTVVPGVDPLHQQKLAGHPPKVQNGVFKGVPLAVPAQPVQHTDGRHHVSLAWVPPQLPGKHRPVVDVQELLHALHSPNRARVHLHPGDVLRPAVQCHRTPRAIVGAHVQIGVAGHEGGLEERARGEGPSGAVIHPLWANSVALVPPHQYTAVGGLGDRHVLLHVSGLLVHEGVVFLRNVPRDLVLRQRGVRSGLQVLRAGVCRGNGRPNGEGVGEGQPCQRQHQGAAHKKGALSHRCWGKSLPRVQV